MGPAIRPVTVWVSSSAALSIYKVKSGNFWISHTLWVFCIIMALHQLIKMEQKLFMQQTFQLSSDDWQFAYLTTFTRDTGVQLMYFLLY